MKDPKEPSAAAMAAARRFVNYDPSKPKNVEVFGTNFVWQDAIDAKHAEDKMTIRVAMALEEYAAEVLAMQSWDPINVKGTA